MRHRSNFNAIGRHTVLDPWLRRLEDPAPTNIFSGHLLLKNFGVSRHGRVVFYDYDELCLLTECNFCAIPQPHHEEEMDDGWFYASHEMSFPSSSRAF